MDMVAAIQAAKSQLEAETTKKQAKQKVSPTAAAAATGNGATAASATTANQGTARHQKSNSFQFGASDVYYDKQHPRPPTNIVSFKESSRGHQQPQSQQLQQGLQQLNWKKASSSSSSAVLKSSSSSLPPLHGDYISSEYQYGVNKYNLSDTNNNYNPNDMDNDNFSITSSLSGTLPDLGGVVKFPPPPPPPPPPALTRDHLLAGLNLLPSTNSHSASHPPTSTTTQSKGSTSVSNTKNANNSTSTTATSSTSPTIQGVGANTSINIRGDSNNNINSNKSVPMNDSSSSNNNTTTTNNKNNNKISNTTTITATKNSNKNNTTIDDSNSNKNNNNNNNNNNTNVANNNIKSSDSSSLTSDDPAKRRIEEIMSEYQGRVDTILRRQRSGSHGDINNSIMNNNSTTTTTTTGNSSFTPASPGSILLAASLPVPKNNGAGGEENSVVDGTNKKNPRLLEPISSPTVNVDDILSTYKKRVGEIMSKASPSPDRKLTNYSAANVVMMNPPQLPITLAVENVILDDEISDYDRESAVDGVISLGGGGGGTITDEDDDSEEEDGSDYGMNDHISRDGSKRSQLGSLSSTSRNAMNSGNNNNDNNNKNADTTGSMSERANAVLQNIHSPGRGEGGDGRTNDTHSENSSGASTHISGASSASELSARKERGESSRGYYSNQQQQQSQQQWRGPAQSEVSANKVSSGKERSSNTPTEGVHDPREVPIRRQDSLLRAQELTASTTFEGANRRHSMPKNYFQDDTARIDLEKRLSEALLREEELSRENIRLEKNLKEARSELDKVQSEARSTKYSSSEQASRIIELERKLRNEKERYEELERERDVMKEEYEQDLEDQKDINRQLEQMVMSEEFEKELEDEINQVKELEHANRRFKVKIDMLERERNTIAKKYETKIEDYTNKISSLEGQLAEWETRAGSLENNVRNTAEEWEAKLAEEKRNSRDMQFDLEKTQTKLKGMEAELTELRDSSSKIDEYEQVLGKLMERNEELEGLAKSAKDELEMAHRQEQLSDRRRAVKMKDLEEMIEEQRITIEQQQETLDESVKTILKLYSLNNENGGDLSVLTEEKLTDMARAMVPRLGSSRPAVPLRRDEDREETSGYTSIRPPVMARNSVVSSGINASRGRETGKEVEKVIHEQSLSRSRGRTSYNRLSGLDESERQIMDGKTQPQIRPRHHTTVTDDLGINNKNIGISGGIARHSSRGRGGDRTESIRQLTERARTPARDRDRNRSPAAPRTTFRRLSTPESYDPKGPKSDSLALVPVATPDYSYGGQYDIPPPRSRSVGRRELTDDRDRSIAHDTQVISYNPRPQTYDRHHSSSTSHSNRNQYNSHNSGSRRERGRIDSHQQPDRERDRRERDKGDQRIIDRNRERDNRGADRNKGWGGGVDSYYQGMSSERGGGHPYPNRSGRDRSNARDRESRSSHRGSNGDGHGDAKIDSYSYSRRSTRDRSPTGETDLSEDDVARAWRGGGGKHHGGGKAGVRSSRRDP